MLRSFTYSSLTARALELIKSHKKAKSINSLLPFLVREYVTTLYMQRQFSKEKLPLHIEKEVNSLMSAYANAEASQTKKGVR